MTWSLGPKTLKHETVGPYPKGPSNQVQRIFKDLQIRVLRALGLGTAKPHLVGGGVDPVYLIGGELDLIAPQFRWLQV